MHDTDFTVSPAVAAARYAAWGWPVLPLHSPTGAGCSCGDGSCSSPAKHPRIPRGVHQATTARGTVEAWWRRWPSANVAVATGQLVVLDVDGEAGERSLRRLMHEHGPLPATPWVSTARGRHLYFLALGLEIGNSAGRLGPGLDVRGRGGYVVAPPSLHHTGWRYRWHQLDLGLAAIPAWATRERDHGATRSPGQAIRRDEDAYVRAALDGEISDVAGAEPGTRNDTLNRAAFRLGQLAGAGLTTTDALREPLLDAARAAGLEDFEAGSTIDRGLAAGAEHPRELKRLSDRSG